MPRARRGAELVAVGGGDGAADDLPQLGAVAGAQGGDAGLLEGALGAAGGARAARADGLAHLVAGDHVPLDERRRDAQDVASSRTLPGHACSLSAVSAGTSRRLFCVPARGRGWRGR